MQYVPLEERFWAKVRKDDGCWEWTAGTIDGYGHIRAPRERRDVLAHRLSWEWSNGPIPQGRHVLHSCDNRRCVRPDHLFLGDNATNVADRVAKGRSADMRGSRNPKAKLTREQVADIRRRYGPAPIGHPRRGERRSASLLAEEFGVSRSTIYHIVRGWTWPG